MSAPDKIFLPPYNVPAFRVQVYVDGAYAYFVRQSDYEKLAEELAKAQALLKGGA